MSRPIGKLFRLLASRLDAEGECLVLLPHGFRQVLLDTVYRFMWESVWLEDDYKTRAVLTDGQWQVVELGIARLSDCVDIQIDNNITVNCNDCGGSGGDSVGGFSVDCGGDGGTITITPDDPTNYDPNEHEPADQSGGDFDETGPVPDSLQENGYETWDDYSQYICDFAHYLPESVARFLDGLETVTDKISTVAGVLSVIAFFFPATWGVKAGSIALTELVEAILQIFVGETVFDNLSELADELRDSVFSEELVCLIYDNRYNLPVAHSEWLLHLNQRITSFAWSGEAKDKIYRLIAGSVPLRWMYGEITDNVLKPFAQGNDCSACAGSGVESVSFTFDADDEGWSSNADAGWFDTFGGEMWIWSHSTVDGMMTAAWDSCIGPKLGNPVPTSGRLKKVRFDLRRSDTGTYENDVELRIDPDSAFAGPHVFTTPYTEIPIGSWVTKEFTMDVEIPVTGGGTIARFWNQKENGTQAGVGCAIDNVYMEFELT